MRYFVKKYSNDKTFATETSNDGSEVVSKEGEREIGQRISAYAEVMCDDNEAGYDRAIEAIDRLKSQLEKKRRP